MRLTETAGYTRTPSRITWCSTRAARRGETKNPPCQSARRALRNLSGKRNQLFSSFLRGASRPKSPRVAAVAAGLYCAEARPRCQEQIAEAHRKRGEREWARRVVGKPQMGLTTKWVSRASNLEASEEIPGGPAGPDRLFSANTAKARRAGECAGVLYSVG